MDKKGAELVDEVFLHLGKALNLTAQLQSLCQAWPAEQEQREVSTRSGSTGPYGALKSIIHRSKGRQEPTISFKEAADWLDDVERHLSEDEDRAECLAPLMGEDVFSAMIIVTEIWKSLLPLHQSNQET